MNPAPAKVTVLFRDFYGTGSAAVEVRAEKISRADPRLAGPHVLLASCARTEHVAEILDELRPGCAQACTGQASKEETDDRAYN